MAQPDPFATMRSILLGETSITSLLLPQTALPSLTVAPIFALSYPRKVAGAAQTGYTGHDWAALLQQQAIRLVLITAAGRIASVGDTTRVPYSRPRMDIQCFGRSESDAMTVYLAVDAFLKEMSNERAALSAGTSLIRDVTVEGGPLSFDDPTTEAPEIVGTYGASFIEAFVA